MLHSRLLKYLDEVARARLDPQGVGSAQCCVFGDQSADPGSGKRAGRSDFRAHAAAAAAHRDRRSADRPCARDAQRPSAGRIAYRGAEGPDPRRGHDRHHEWLGRRAAAAVSQRHSRCASARPHSSARAAARPDDQRGSDRRSRSGADLQSDLQPRHPRRCEPRSASRRGGVGQASARPSGARCGSPIAPSFHWPFPTPP